MLQLASDYEKVGSSSRETRSVPQLDLLALLRIFIRRWRLIAMVMLVGIGSGVAYMLTATPLYTANFLVLIDPKKTSLLDHDAAGGDRVVDPGMVESQVEVLKSDSVALMAVRALDLTRDTPAHRSGLGILSYIKAHFRHAPPPPSQADLEQAAVGGLTGRTKVSRLGVTYVLQGSYTGDDPRRTMQIANALANSYVDSQLQGRYDEMRRATDWLQSRLKSLRADTSTAETAVQRYKAENNIVDTAHGLMGDQQLADANSQLATARNETSAAKARLDRVREVLKSPDVVNATVSDALRDDILNRLRAQYLDLTSRQSDLTARLGPNHAAVVTIRNQLVEVTKAARDELGRVASSSQSDYEIALSNERSLQTNLSALVTQADTTSRAQVKLRDLESSAQTFRNLYDNMLQKMQETTQEQTSPDVSARVLTPATIPGAPSSPKLPIVMSASVIGGLLIGCALALSREMLGNAFKTPEDVKNYAGVECLGTLPQIKVARSTQRALRRKGVAPNILAAQTPVARHTVLAPFSRFTETIRNVKVSIDAAHAGRSAVISGIVSSVPKEGKTTFSSNLGLLTAQMGHRTLLIDGDMHNPSLTRTLTPDAKLGLVDILEGRCTIEQAIVRDASTGLDFIPAVIKQRKPNSVSLLTSDAMAQMLASARERYEYIFFDLPPIVPVVDVKAAVQMFESLVLVIEWGRTSRDVVHDALITSEQIRQRLIGVVMNKADPSELKRIESYRGPEYGSYYLEAGTAS